MRLDLLKDIDINKLSLAQKKVLAICVGTLLAFFIIWLFIFIPTTKKVKDLKAELAGLDGQIQQIEGRAGDAKSLDAGIRLLEDKLKVLRGKFPSTEEESIKAFANLAQKSGVTIDSIRPNPRKELLDESGAPVKAEAKTCYVISLVVSARCTFSDLVKFSEIVENNLPALATIQKMDVNKDPSGTNLLNVSMDVNLYLLM
jgi:Tfp pilus assembly protein PilO